ncbi:hypothetical protein N7462_001361 [Penicillium macrosclerotiorum]|uniref:uncharacterized protein n=1 Tax=Penicillium macrosclerotiorum TaxID=303699 RepID=UPI0025466239|nr:uncharacterized protein N7462_001361 [Penicillium macrosclerotiorum]KAJ5691938.1 hypothetical protein N7462_001361 [Penicillium macrosclerotiorum]
MDTEGFTRRLSPLPAFNREDGSVRLINDRASDTSSDEYIGPSQLEHAPDGESRGYFRERRPMVRYLGEVNLAEHRRNRDGGPETSSKPAVVWYAKLFSRENGLPFGQDLRQPDLLIIDDRPIELCVGVAPRQPQIDTKDTKEPALKIPSWENPVFTIEVFLETDLLQREIREIRRDPNMEKLALKRVSRRHLVVHSPYLLLALSEIVQYYPSFHSKGQRSIAEPYAVLFHHFDAIEARAGSFVSTSMCQNTHDADTQEAQQIQKHIQNLLDFLRPIRENKILDCERNLAESTPRVTFDMIWYLLKPGMDVYVHIDGSIQAAVLTDVKRGGEDWSSVWKPENDNWWLIELWRLETDGLRIARRSTSANIVAYAGLREVINLAVCPVSIWDAHDGGERRREILRRNGTFFKALCQGNLLVDYNGPIKGTNEHYNGKLVIDHRRGQEDHNNHHSGFPRIQDNSDRFKAYDQILINNDASGSTNQETQRRLFSMLETYTARPAENNSTGARVEDWKDNAVAVDELTEHQLLLLCPEALAYALRYKQWIVISLDHVQESVPSDESIRNLVISEAELKTIQALSHRQNSKIKHWSADFIEGKGSGQIILLHGPPGVGKTYTVEAISEWLHRPLLALTVADIGTVETLVEGELLKWFSLAEAWNAVLLVDEADIFLERRQNRDLARNGLVSAFLRRMEYFKGLLFLTTNRVGQIDDAFISRVHIAIGYPALDEDGRRKVWNGFFRKLVRDRAGKIQIAPDAKAWVLETTGETQLNGRDIRNALQTAITLAEFESQEDPDYDESLVTIVTKAHFQKVLDMCNRFRTYVTSIRREDEKKRAQGRGDRNDYGRGTLNEMDGLVDLARAIGK